LSVSRKAVQIRSDISFKPDAVVFVVIVSKLSRPMRVARPEMQRSSLAESRCGSDAPRKLSILLSIIRDYEIDPHVAEALRDGAELRHSAALSTPKPFDISVIRLPIRLFSRRR
jgi:hypothetical protein